jgi:hypothetical protein
MSQKPRVPSAPPPPSPVPAPVHIVVEKKRPHPARVPLWLSIFLVPIAVLNAGLPTTAAGAVAVVWIVCALVLLARLPHD